MQGAPEAGGNIHVSNEVIYYTIRNTFNLLPQLYELRREWLITLPEHYEVYIH